MPVLSGLRRTAIIAATFIYAFTPPIGGVAATAAVICATAAVIVSVSDADARPRVRDHRNVSSGKPKT